MSVFTVEDVYPWSPILEPRLSMCNCREKTNSEASSLSHCIRLFRVVKTSAICEELQKGQKRLNTWCSKAHEIQCRQIWCDRHRENCKRRSFEMMACVLTIITSEEDLGATIDCSMKCQCSIAGEKSNIRSY